MAVPILATKLYVPPPRPKVVLRPHLIDRLNEGLAMGCKLTLISAGAGFGKTTLVSEWIAGSGRPATWLSLDENDKDAKYFLIYLTSALQKISSIVGLEALELLRSSQPPPIESILTTLLNEINNIPDSFIFILDDYHVIDDKSVGYSSSYPKERISDAHRHP